MSASRPGRTKPENRVTLTGGRGRGRPRTSRPSAPHTALLGRLRRLEVLVLAYMDPASKSRLEDSEMRAMLDAVRDGWGKSDRKAVEVQLNGEAGGDVSASVRRPRRAFDRGQTLTATLGEVAAKDHEAKEGTF